MNPDTVSSPRPAKKPRLRQACEPCRRKKSKCPGQRPNCSFCVRLGQSCFYANDIPPNDTNTDSTSRGASSAVESPQKLEDRVQLLEAKLRELLGVVGQQQSEPRTPTHPSSHHSRETTLLHAPAHQPSAFSTSSLPPWDIVSAAAEQYLHYCDCQPLPLFYRKSFMVGLRDRDPEVIYAILGLSSRFSTESFDELENGYAESARKIVMRRVADGQVELSTLQTLCLLSLIDFTNGNNHRASLHSSLAMNLAFVAGLGFESNLSFSESVSEERRRCFWSIIFFKRLHGANACDLDFSAEENFSWYPTSTGLPPKALAGTARPSVSGLDPAANHGNIRDSGIVSYAVQLSEVWFKTTKYAKRRGTPSKMPPWSPKSEYATILAQQMEFETRMPHIHRFKPAAFAKRSVAELQTNRDYWGPWLFIQVLYHTNLCLLNHPLILALRLRTIRSQIPEIFLQHTSDLISSHTSWIMHLIDLINVKSFRVSDPFVGHCVAIVATIHLHESFAEDSAIRRTKQTNFAKCLGFIQDIGRQWPHIARLADKLQGLQNTVSASYHNTGNFEAPTRGLLIDLARFWEILEYSSASELYDSAGQLFGPSLYIGPKNSAHEVSDTSPLPPPTRLGSAALTNSQGTVENAPLANDEGSSHGMVDPFLRPPLSTNLSYGYLAEPPYSNDELAVLADSFFTQRNDFDGNMGDWWNTGNL